MDNTCENWVCKPEDCVPGAKKEIYCRTIIKPEAPGAFSPKGADIIAEQLRSYFLWEQLKSGDEKLKWWRYMTKFDHDVCVYMTDMGDCSYTVMKNVEISEKVIQNVRANVEQTYKNLTEGSENVLRTSYQESKDASIFFYPEATINGRNFYGLFKAPEVFETICNSLLDPPQECIKFIKQNH